MQNPLWFGVDWDGPLPGVSDNHVAVEPPSYPLCQQDLIELTTVVDPLEPSSDYGIHLYVECLDFVRRKMALY